MMLEYSPPELSADQRAALLGRFTKRIKITDGSADALIEDVQNAAWCYGAVKASPPNMRAELEKFARNCKATAFQLRALSEGKSSTWIALRRLIAGDPLRMERTAEQLEGLAIVAADLLARGEVFNLTGRPQDRALRLFVSCLAQAYEKATGQRPSCAANGKFYGFANEAASLIDAGSVSRDLIAQVLKDAAEVQGARGHLGRDPIAKE